MRELIEIRHEFTSRQRGIQCWQGLLAPDAKSGNNKPTRVSGRRAEYLQTKFLALPGRISMIGHKKALFVSGLVSLAIAVVLCSSALAGKENGQLDVYFIDTEGGAATLIVTPAGEAVLVDT